MQQPKITLNLSEQELKALEERSRQLGKTPEQVLKDCLNCPLSASDLKLETTLLYHQAHYHAILNAIPDLMLRVKPDGACIDFLPPRISNSGVFLTVTNHLSEVLPPPLLEQQLKIIEEVRQTGQVYIYEHQLEKLGQTFYEEVRVCPVNQDEVLLLIRDITTQKKAQAERDRFFNLSIDMLCIANFDGYFLRLNPAWEQTLGYTQAELMAHPYLDFVHPDDQPKTLEEAQKILTGAKTLEFENRYRCRNGDYRWLLWNATPLVEEKVIYSVVHDITQRKQAEEKLKQEVKILLVEIDEQKRRQRVASISQTDYFQQLKAEANHLRLEE